MKMKQFTPEELGEIRTMYREAANPRAQIGILADLYACDRQDIERVLGLPESPRPAVVQPDKPKREQPRWAPEDVVRLISLYGAGYTPAEIADRLGVPLSRVKTKLSNLRRRGGGAA